MKGKPVRTMMVEIRVVNLEKGWRSGTNTFGDYIALLHTEVGEATDAYRSYKTVDVTDAATGKPEGVGSEFADVLIRTLDLADVFSLTLPPAWVSLDMFRRISPPAWITTFADHTAWLHKAVAKLGGSLEPRGLEFRNAELRELISSLLYVCDLYGIKLEDEYERKIAFNRTRPFQHGGKVL